MGILFDDAVIIRQSEKEGEPSVITVNCPDKTGLGSDLCRIILFFGLTVVRTDVSTDGKWCYIVFWVVGKPSTRWSLLKKRLMGACPSCSGISYFRAELQPPRPPDVFLLKFCCHDRRGLLHDVTEVLCELELTIKRVKVSTTPDGKVMDLFFITDTRVLLHTKNRQDDTYDHLKAVLGDAMISCDIQMVGPEIAACSQGPSFLSDAISEDMFNIETLDERPDDCVAFKPPSITMDNSLSPSHTLVQIVCEDHKGLLYDVMRTLKDYNIQISYGRFTTKGKSECEMDLFIMQADGKKIIDPSKQSSLRSRLQMELSRPLRVALISRGPDSELLVANPVEITGNGRPLVFYDITLALKMLDTQSFRVRNCCTTEYDFQKLLMLSTRLSSICRFIRLEWLKAKTMLVLVIEAYSFLHQQNCFGLTLLYFQAEIGRYMIGDREWEVYRVLLDEGDGSSVLKQKIEETVWKMLMSWE
ncbi:UNVERIFIED_CONTAM: ACT domain-containing protein ACR10 [Sesamum latifolium]|uniref:ACT domain-containing protein ACR n=1 Tax=Sesamum latifolium TaxID=2727402 RepID=A0AAW2TY57_9LAMI